MNDEQCARFVDGVNQGTGTFKERLRGLHLYGESALNLLMIGLEMLHDGEIGVLECYAFVARERKSADEGEG
jgi:hypothetical protein